MIMALKIHNFAQKHHHFAHYACSFGADNVGVNYVKSS